MSTRWWKVHKNFLVQHYQNIIISRLLLSLKNSLRLLLKAAEKNVTIGGG